MELAAEFKWQEHHAADVSRLEFGRHENFLIGKVSVEAPTPPVPPALVFGGLQTLGDTKVSSLTWTNDGAACVLESSATLSGGWSTVLTPFATNVNWVATPVANRSAALFFASVVYDRARNFSL